MELGKRNTYKIFDEEIEVYDKELELLKHAEKNLDHHIFEIKKEEHIIDKMQFIIKKLRNDLNFFEEKIREFNENPKKAKNEKSTIAKRYGLYSIHFAEFQKFVAKYEAKFHEEQSIENKNFRTHELLLKEYGTIKIKQGNVIHDLRKIIN